jgi:2-methylisocitrate lyase-like PEP mutase family enzyme
MPSTTPDATRRSETFLALHRPDPPLVLPNPWDRGSAKLLAAIGFQALATTSAGFAATLGRRDGAISRDEAVQHCADIVGATDLPVSADFENGFADDPDDVAANVRLAAETGLAGCSIEDYTGRPDDPFYDDGLAAERVVAAVEAGRGVNPAFVITARCEYLFRGRSDLAATIARLQAYESAGAHVLYAPALFDAADIKSVVTSVGKPVNVLGLPGLPSVAELGELGVCRISVGSGFNMVALGAVVQAGRELLDEGTFGWWATAGAAQAVWADAFG